MHDSYLFELEMMGWIVNKTKDIYKQELKVSKVVKHELYTAFGKDDIALLKLEVFIL